MLGRRTDYGYDDAGRRTSVTLPAVLDSGAGSPTEGQTVRPKYRYEYDAQGRQTAIVDPRGSRTEFAYDAEGRQVSRTLPLGVASAAAGDFEETKVYDTAPGPGYGQIRYETDFEGRVTAYAYDDSALGRGRMTATRYYDNDAARAAGNAVRTVTYAYDALGRQVEVDDSAFATPTKHEYDAEGRLTRIDSPQGDLRYAYDALGRKTSTWTGPADPAQATTRTDYDYDALGRLKVVTAVRRFGQAVDVDPSAPGVQPEATRYAYDAAGWTDYELFAVAGGDVTKDYGYDAQGRVSHVRHFRDADGDHALDAGEALLDGFAYTYLADGSRSGEVWTDSLGNVTTKGWSYDALNRLVSETYAGVDGSADALSYTDTYRFDLASNRAKLVHVGSDGTWSVKGEYDANDRLLVERRDAGNDGSVERTTAFRYDHPNGTVNGGTGQTIKTVTGDQPSTTSFAYDATGRMTGVTVDGTTVAYQYDHNGFRVVRTAGGQATVYHVDPANPTGYAQSLEEGTDTGDGRLSPAEVAAAFTLAMDVVTQATRTQTLHLLTDAHGSTRAALDAVTGGVAQRYAYDAYGRDLGLATPLTALRYAGEAIDPLTGLSFNRARWYNSVIGRFDQLDAWSGSSRNPTTFNRYVYALNTPTAYSDPSGNVPAGIIPALTSLQITVGLGALLAGILLTAPGSAQVSTQATIGAINALTNAVDLAVGGYQDLADEIGHAAGDVIDEVLGFAKNVNNLAKSISKAQAAAVAAGVAALTTPPRVYFVPRAVTPTIYNNTVTWLAAKPNYFVLNYAAGGRAFSRANRNAAIAGRGPAGFLLSWDEFPYASTYEGGAGSYVAAVPALENSIQGGYLSVFYRYQLKSTAGPFLVLPIP